MSTSIKRTSALLTAAAAATATLSSPALAQNFSTTSSHPDLANFAVYDPSFQTVLGRTASIQLLYNASEALFHEGPVYNATGDTLYMSSNRLALPAGQVDASTDNQTIKLSAVRGVSSDDLGAITLAALDTSTIRLPNGGVAHTGGSGMLFVAQGTKTATSGVYSIPDPLNAPNVSVPVVTGFLGGRQFNSPNDVVVNPVDNNNNGGTGTIWFTDPSYGSQQGIRNAPQLPTQVYRYDPGTNSTRVVADGFEQPNGLAFNADYSVLYVTDASYDADTNPTGRATIYAFDVAYTDDRPAGNGNGTGTGTGTGTGGSFTFLTNRRVFAFAPSGIPDGIKVDAQGNVWSGVGSGVAVWNPAGLLLGEITIRGGAANFGFGATERTVFVLGETMLWRVTLA